MKLTNRIILKILLNQNFKDPIKISKIGIGEWSTAYTFISKNAKYVIRFSDTDEDFRKDKFAHYLASKSIPIPEIENIGIFEDKYYAISEFLEGDMIDNLTHDQLTQVLPSFFDLLISLKNIDTSNTSGFGGWGRDGNGEFKTWKDFILDIKNENPNKRFKWKDKLEINKEINELYESTYNHLLEFIDFLPNERSLVHNDLLHFNLFIKNNKVSGVIDWGCSLYGDFLYDLAMFGLWSFYYKEMENIDFIKEAKKYFHKNSIIFENFNERLTCYQLHLALDSLQYSTFTNNQENIFLVKKRIQEIIVKKN